MKKLCLLSDIPNYGSKGFNINDVALFAVRKNHDVFAYVNRCPHLGIALEWQPDQFLDSGGDLIQCAMHGALFNIENGECLSGPCSGQSLQQLKVDIIDEAVFVLLSEHTSTSRLTTESI